MQLSGIGRLEAVMNDLAAESGGFPAIIVGDPVFTADSREALAATGGRVVAEIAWNALPIDTESSPRPAVLVVDTIGANDDCLAAHLPHLASVATMRGVPIVVSFALGSTDLVAATLMGRHAQLLCEPTPADRVIALTLASQAVDHPHLHDSRAYEGEAARLRRMNEEVARIAEVLSRLTRRETSDRAAPLEVSDRQSVFRAAAHEAIPIEPEEIRRAIRSRRLRDKHFGEGLFEEPAWDMILDLFAAELEGARVSVSSLCIAAAVAPTTALRWISKLVEAGLFERQPDPFDRRRAFMELSERASKAMRDYMADLRRMGLSLA